MNTEQYQYHMDGTVTYMGKRLRTYLMTKNGHIAIDTPHGRKQLHRLVWIVHHGDIDRNTYIVPKNGDWMDTRIENLTISGPKDNRMGKGEGKYDHLKGCHFDINSEKWVARRRIGGVQKFLGIFATEKEAHEAYKRAK